MITDCITTVLRESQLKVYQKEHALLKSFARKFLKAAFANKLPIEADYIINTNQVSL